MMPPVARRAEVLFERQLEKVRVRTDRMFALLMILQWLTCVALACWNSPYRWQGTQAERHPAILFSILIGGLLTSVPVFLSLTRAGHAVTRYVIAIAQMSFSALLIHLTDGRIETHFHIFGSLTFLAFYREWRLLIPASLVIAVDHLVRGYYWPASIYGVAVSTMLRSIEHIGWVVYIDVFLAWSCIMSLRDMRRLAEQQAALEDAKESVERAVHQRTVELRVRTAELEREIRERKRMEQKLIYARKMESIGRLSAGIAHEINTPVQYVGDNTTFLQENFQLLLQLIARYQTALDDPSPANARDHATAIADFRREIDFDFLAEEIPEAIEQSHEGLERIAGIVKAMRNFSHPDSERKEPADLNAAIQSTATVTRATWKYIADLVLDLDPHLPLIPAHLGDFNQVVLNLIVNAADAIAEKHRKTGEKGRIFVSSRVVDGWAEIAIEDDGTGIHPSIRGQIFDPFFTTKPVGKGTGQGLSICHSIISKHNGELSFTSQVGEGTRFLIRLPLHDEDADETATELAECRTR
jgi:signal transduction histidine kinase